MMKIYVVALCCIYGSISTYAQQQSSWSSFYENGFIWNPALTARWNTIESSVTARQEWVGFDGAPRNATIGYQYPFVRLFTKVSAGGFIEIDEVGPYQKIGLAGTYAYKIKPKWFGSQSDVLSFGMKVGVHQFRFSDEKVTTFSGEFNGEAIPDVTGFLPSVGGGIYYMNTTDLTINKSHFYFGLGANNLIPTQVNTGPLGSYTNLPHLYLHGGYRQFTHKEDTFFEPSVFVNYAFAQGLNLMAACRYEWIDRFWVAGGAATSREVFGQLGFIFNRESLLGPIVRDGVLRLGVKSDYNFGPFRQFSGLGFEAYVAYLFSNEPF